MKNRLELYNYLLLYKSKEELANIVSKTIEYFAEKGMIKKCLLHRNVVEKWYLKDLEDLLGDKE